MVGFRVHPGKRRAHLIVVFFIGYILCLRQPKVVLMLKPLMAQWFSSDDVAWMLNVLILTSLV